MTERLTRVAAYALVTREDALLLCRVSARVPRLAGCWTLPGGGIDFGESPEEAMIREVDEETGLRVEPAGLVAVSSFVGPVEEGVMHRLRILFRARVTGGVLRPEVDGSTDACRWVPRDELCRLPLHELVTASLPHAFAPGG